MEQLYGKSIAELQAICAELGMPRFAAGQIAGWLYRREWNMVKLTGRGLEGHGEAFAVQVLPDAVVIRFR